MSDDCEYPPCSKPGKPRRAANIFEQGRRYVLNLCDEHYDKLRKRDPELVDWLITRVWC
jgi:hypothetical protein